MIGVPWEFLVFLAVFLAICVFAWRYADGMSAGFMRNTVRIFSIFFIVFAGSISIITLIFTLLFASLGKFDRDTWREAKGSEFDTGDCRRYDMVKDVVDNRIHIGMKREALLKLLGQPDTSKNGCFDYYFMDCGRVLRYPGRLEICLSEDGTVDRRIVHRGDF